ncbi:hypothetical protein STEG23_017958 [Scotinomys teguina]
MAAAKDGCGLEAAAGNGRRLHLGIPEAVFVEDVDSFMKQPGNETADTVLKKLDEQYQKYKFMELNLAQKKRRLKGQIPEIKQTLEILKYMQKKKESTNSMETRFLLADNLYCKASVPPTDKVCLWLGANVMLEYDIDEAQALLEKNLSTATKNLDSLEEDLDFLRDQFTTTEVKSANQDLQNRLLNLESANLMQELQSINNKCIAKIGFVDNKYEYLMDRTLTLQSEVVTTQTLCKEERLSLIDKIRSLESCVSEEHNRWYDSMKNLESQAREEVHSLEQTLCARLQALEETLCKHDKEPNKQKGKTIKVITSPNGSNPMAYPVNIHERPADDIHPEPYVTRTLQPISIRDFKNMKEAIVTYGIHSTYVKQMLNSWSTSNRIIPDDWHQLTSAVLEYSQQLQWKSWLREEARNLEQQAEANSQIFQFTHIHTELEQDIAKTICQSFYHNGYEKLDSNQNSFLTVKSMAFA